MKLVYPWAPTHADRDCIEREARSLKGQTIVAVRYLVPGTSDATERQAHSGFDEATMGVELTMSGGIVTLPWLMDNFKEGLALVLAGSQEYATARRYKATEATDFLEWQARRAPIVTVALGWQISSEGMTASVWSLRLNFENDTSVTFALGEWAIKAHPLGINARAPELEGAVTYTPDNVLVIFDQALAQGYRVNAAAHPGGPSAATPSWSAWGDSV
jgi:hypothetical protein